MFKKRSRKIYFLVFVVPTLIAFMIGFIYPFFQGIYLSFCKFRTTSNATWVGFDNYIKAFQNESFIRSFWFTALFVVVSVILINAIAFFVELLLYCNILPDDIYDYVEKVVFHSYQPEPPIRFVHNLDSLMKIGLGLLNRRFNDLEVGVYLVLAQDNFDSQEEYEHVVSYTPGYNKLSWAFHDNEAKLAWEVTYHLSVARNFLKNKPWKQTGVMTDEKALQSEIVLAFIEYLGYLNYCGFDGESLYVLRFKKHRVNQFRQKSNY